MAGHRLRNREETHALLRLQAGDRGRNTLRMLAIVSLGQVRTQTFPRKDERQRFLEHSAGPGLASDWRASPQMA